MTREVTITNAPSGVNLDLYGNGIRLRTKNSGEVIIVDGKEILQGGKPAPAPEAASAKPDSGEFVPRFPGISTPALPLGPPHMVAGESEQGWMVRRQVQAAAGETGYLREPNTAGENPQEGPVRYFTKALTFTPDASGQMIVDLPWPDQGGGNAQYKTRIAMGGRMGTLAFRIKAGAGKAFRLVTDGVMGKDFRAKFGLFGSPMTNSEASLFPRFDATLGGDVKIGDTVYATFAIETPHDWDLDFFVQV